MTARPDTVASSWTEKLCELWAALADEHEYRLSAEQQLAMAGDELAAVRAENSQLQERIVALLRVRESAERFWIAALPTVLAYDNRHALAIGNLLAEDLAQSKGDNQ